jgi:hypothetical protein
MSKYLKFGGTLAIALLLAGAGCNAPIDSDSTDSDSDSLTEETTETATDAVEYKTEGNGIIELKATAVGSRKIKFEWNLSRAVEEPTHFILLRDEQAKPEHDQKTYWFRQHGSRRAATWVNLPAGEQYFRICSSNDGETCSSYSDDLKITVLSGPVSTLKPTEKIEDAIDVETEITSDENAPEETNSEEAVDGIENEDMVEDNINTEATDTEDAETPTEDVPVEDTVSTSTEDVVTTTEDFVPEPTTDDATSTDSGTDTSTTTENTTTSTENTTETTTTTE